MTVSKVHFSSATDLWYTPQWLFDRLNDEFKFDRDVCALPENAKCANYFTPEQDALLQTWEGVCWMNPPYGRVIGKWTAKAFYSVYRLEAKRVVCLLPARVDTNWWWSHCIQGEIRILKGRLKFGGAKNSAPFPSAVVILDRNLPSCTKWWDIKP